MTCGCTEPSVGKRSWNERWQITIYFFAAGKTNAKDGGNPTNVHRTRIHLIIMPWRRVCVSNSIFFSFRFNVFLSFSSYLFWCFDCTTIPCRIEKKKSKFSTILNERVPAQSFIYEFVCIMNVDVYLLLKLYVMDVAAINYNKCRYCRNHIWFNSTNYTEK